MPVPCVPATWRADLPLVPPSDRYAPSTLPAACDGNGHGYAVTSDGGALAVTCDGVPGATVQPPAGFTIQCATAWRAGHSTVVRLVAHNGVVSIVAGVELPDTGKQGEATQARGDGHKLYP
jgi:hypothetical protein